VNSTLVKGLGLLEILANSDRPLGVTELASQLDISKSNVHRLLQTLVQLQYVKQAENTGYFVSVRLWELSARVIAGFDLPRVAAPFMQQLLDETQESVHLSVLDGDEVVYIHKLDSPQPVRAYTQIGGRAPAYCVATGKALLAFEAESRLASLSGRLKAYTPQTLIGPEAFLGEMQRIRQTGYAVNRGEWREGVHGLAAPIYSTDGGVVAAMGISGPAERLKASRIKQLTGYVVDRAAGLTGALSTNPSPRD